jgi:phage repressor protein C with HTH and peptisase S24 domain
MEAAESIRQWLLATSAAKGVSLAEWAKRAGIAASTVQRAAKPGYQFVTSSRTLAKLAEALDVPPPPVTVTTVNLDRPQLSYLPVRYEVGAGVWRNVDDGFQDLGEQGAVASDPSYAGFDQWMERVVGDSMDQEYQPGTLLHVVDAIAIGYAPRTGDHVIIERTEDGARSERSVKEVLVTPEGVQLICRSNNPRWSAPIDYAEGRDQEHFTVAIVAYVLGSYRSRRTR